MSFCSLASEIKLIKLSSVVLVLVRYKFNPWIQDSHLIIWSERVKIKNNETF